MSTCLIGKFLATIKESAVAHACSKLEDLYSKKKYLKIMSHIPSVTVSLSLHRPH